jgi:hypothetical protein
VLPTGAGKPDVSDKLKNVRQLRVHTNTQACRKSNMSATTNVRVPPQRRSVEPLVCSVEQTSRVTNLSLRKINQMIRGGRLKSVLIDGRRLIYVSSVKALLPDA